MIPGYKLYKPRMTGKGESFLGTQDGSMEEDPFVPGVEKQILFAHKTRRISAVRKLMGTKQGMKHVHRKAKTSNSGVMEGWLPEY